VDADITFEINRTFIVARAHNIVRCVTKLNTKRATNICPNLLFQTGLFPVLTVSHGLVTGLESLKNVLRTTNENQESFLFHPNMAAHFL
jgi:hypothetical protein